MSKVNGHDFLVVRNSLTNEVRLISIEECAFLLNGSNKLITRLDIAAIDLVTTKIKNKDELLNLLISRDLARTVLDDVYIVHRCNDVKNLHNDSNSKLSFLEIIYEDDLYNDNIDMLIYMARRRLFGENKIINKEEKEIAKYVSRLIKKAVPGAVESSNLLAYSGALLGRIKKVDLGIMNYINSYSYSKNINVKNDKKQKMIERLCNYRTLRDVVLAEKNLDEEIEFGEKVSQKTSFARKQAAYPLLVFAANKLNEYKNYDLGKPYTENDFLELKKTKNIDGEVSQNINVEQITLNNLQQKQAVIGIGEKDLSDYMGDLEGKPKSNREENTKEIIYSHEIDEENEPYLFSDLDGEPVKRNIVNEMDFINKDNHEDFEEPFKYEDFYNTIPNDNELAENDDNYIEPFLDKDLDDLTEEEILKIASTQKRL